MQCMHNDGLNVEILDPCLKTVILVSDIKSVMSAPILGSDPLDHLNLFQELGSNWPWTDYVT